MSQRSEVLASALQEARALLSVELDRVGEDAWRRPSGVAGWTVKDVLAHLAANQPARVLLVRGVLGGAPGPGPDFDLNAYNARRLEKKRGLPVAELRAELAAGHAQMLALLGSLAEADFDRKGYDPGSGVVTVAEMFHLTAHHEVQHSRHIREALAG